MPYLQHKAQLKERKNCMMRLVRQAHYSRKFSRLLPMTCILTTNPKVGGRYSND